MDRKIMRKIGSYLKTNIINTECLMMSAYKDWAVKECLRELERYSDTPPSIVLEKFAKKMDDFACMRYSETNVIFSIAHDVALDMLDHILS